MALSTAIPLALNKKSVNIGPVTVEIMRLMFIYSKLTMRILRMLMHLNLGHVTLPPGEFLPPVISSLPAFGLMVPGGLMLGFASNFQFILLSAKEGLFGATICNVVIKRSHFRGKLDYFLASRLFPRILER